MKTWSRHRADTGVDEIHFVGGEGLPQTYEQASARAFCRIGLVERYKTSDLSGDEWRFSTEMCLRERPNQPWVQTSTGYLSLGDYARAMYPELYADFQKGKNPWTNRCMVAAVTFSWKGMGVYSASYDGDPVPFLVACGHLSWGLILAGEEGRHYPEALETLCCQPACRQPHTTVYRIKKDRCPSCAQERNSRVYAGGLRGFCSKHARRGDCGLGDSDSNYTVVSGHGPDGHEPDERVVSRARVIRVEG